MGAPRSNVDELTVIDVLDPVNTMVADALHIVHHVIQA
jgi:hypothetical protein